MQFFYKTPSARRRQGQLSSTGVHGATKGASKYAWGVPLRKSSQGCITNLSH